MKNYIGLATSPHDPSLAIVSGSGDVLYAEAAERPLQSKRAWGAVPDHINYIDRLVRQYCDPKLDTIIGVSWSRHVTRRYLTFLPLLNYRIRRATTAYRRRLLLLKYLILTHGSVHTIATIGLEAALAGHGKHVKKQYYDHHLTHAATSAFASPFHSGLCVVADGFGEGSSLAAYELRDRRLLPIKGVYAPISASLGGFYSVMCDICGFDIMRGEEWKVMGLASFGKVDQRLYDLIRPIIRVNGLRLEKGRKLGAIYNELNALRRKPETPAIEYADFAATVQFIFSETLYALLRNLHGLGISDNLLLSGGCALNSSTNGGILENTPFKSLFVSSAPADDGNALGAALLACYTENPKIDARRDALSPYLGSDMKENGQHNLRRFCGLHARQLDDTALFAMTAQAIADGQIIGWVQGRAEFGPRALGNRSILADPRDVTVKERINAKVKFREEFRPFAPSILHERGNDYFECYQFSPYMERTLRFRKPICLKVPGVVHVDGTGRLQSVTESLNPRYYRLLKEFEAITGIPLLLNTSFNVMGKPIIDSVEDAVAVFQTSGLDALVVGNMFYSKVANPI